LLNFYLLETHDLLYPQIRELKKKRASGRLSAQLFLIDGVPSFGELETVEKFENK